MLNRFATLTFVFLLAGCAQTPVQTQNTSAIEAVVPDIAAQFSACKLDQLMADYSLAVEFVSPSTPTPIVGREALRQHLTGACTGSIRPIMKVETQRVHMLSSKSAVITGTYLFGSTDHPDDKPWPAYFVITLARSAGRWLVETQATFAIPES